MTLLQVTNGKVIINDKTFLTYIYDVVEEVYNPGSDEYIEKWGYKFQPFNGQGALSDNGRMLIISASHCLKLAEPNAYFT